MTICTLPPQKKMPRKHRIFTRPRIIVGVMTLLGLAAIQTALIWRNGQKGKPQEQAIPSPSIITEPKNETPSIASRMQQTKEKISTADITAGNISQMKLPVLAEIPVYRTLISIKDASFVSNDDDAEAEPIRALAPVSIVMDWPPRVKVKEAGISTGILQKSPATSYVPPRFIHAQALPKLMANLILNDLRDQLFRSGDNLFVAAVPNNLDKNSVRFPDDNRPVLPAMPASEAIVFSRSINSTNSVRRVTVQQARLTELPIRLFQVGLAGAFADSTDMEWANPDEIISKLPEQSSIRQLFGQWLHAAQNSSPATYTSAKSIFTTDSFQKDLLASGLTFDELYTLGRSVAFLEDSIAAMPFYRAAIEQLKQQPNITELLQNNSTLRQMEMITNVALFVVKDQTVAEQSLKFLMDVEKPGTAQSRRSLFHYANMLARQGKTPDDALIAKLVDAESRNAPELEKQEIQWVLGRALFALERYEESALILLPFTQNSNPMYLTQAASTLAIRATARAGKTETAQSLLDAWDMRFSSIASEAVSQELQSEIAKPAASGLSHSQER